MKLPITLLTAAALMSTAACTTWREDAQANAYAACGEVSDTAERQSCFDRALSDAKRADLEERATEKADQQQREDRAAVNKALGAPDDAVRED